MAGGELHGLAADLGNAGQRARQQASQVVRASGIAVQNHARGVAPVDTGFLRSSIGMQQGSGDVLSVTVTATANYAIFQEHGTIYQPAQPFMRPALETVEPSFISAMEQVGGDIL